jgi:hypothetical protein
MDHDGEELPTFSGVTWTSLHFPYNRYETLSTLDDFSDFQSIYTLAVAALRSATSMSPDPNASNPLKRWAVRFCAYDRLALVNRAAFEEVGDVIRRSHFALQTAICTIGWADSDNMSKKLRSEML